MRLRFGKFEIYPFYVKFFVNYFMVFYLLVCENKSCVCFITYLMLIYEI